MTLAAHHFFLSVARPFGRLAEPSTEDISETVTELADTITIAGRAVTIAGHPITIGFVVTSSEPVSEPASEPASEPMSEPISEPASEPPSEPVSEPATSEAPATPSSDKWRLRMPVGGATSSWGPGFSEVQFLDADGLNLCYGGTASASATDTGGQAYNEAGAFDGYMFPGNGWFAGNPRAANQWLEYTFAAPVQPSFVSVAPLTGFPLAWAAEIHVEYYDGSTWVDYATLETASATDLTPQFFNLPESTEGVTESGRPEKWRVRAPVGSRDPSFGFGLAELRFFDRNGHNVAGAGAPSASASAAISSFSLVGAFDGSTASGSGWYSNSSQTANAWIAVDFGRGFKPASVSVCPLNGFPNSLPLLMVIEYWDGSAWVTWSWFHTATGTDNTYQTFTIPDVPESGTPS